MGISTTISWNLAAAFFLCSVPMYDLAASPGESTKPMAERMEYARNTENEALGLKDSALLAEAYYLWGKAYSIAGDYITSQRYFLNSLRIQEARADIPLMARLYTRLCENECQQKHWERAMAFSEKAITFAAVSQSKLRLAVAYGIQGNLYEAIWEEDTLKNKAEFDSAYQCYRNLQVLMQETSNATGIADADRCLGTLLCKKGDSRAVDLLKRAIAFFREETLYSSLVKTQVYLGLAYLALNQRNAALDELNKARQVYNATELHDISALIIMEEGVISYYQKIGRPDSVIKAMERLHEVKLAQISRDRTKAIEWLNKEYEMQQKESQFEVQRHNIALQRGVILFLLVIALLGILAGGIYFRLSRRNRQMSERNARLVSEQSHRIKNHLQMVASLLDLQSDHLKDSAAREVIADSRLRVGAIAALQKLLFSTAAGSEVSLPEYIRQLISSVLAVYNLEHIRKDIQISESLLRAETAVPVGLILTELLTNACKYAFADHRSPELFICFRKDGRRWHLIVSDNGPGFNPGESASKQSFGMQLIRIQAEQLYADFGFYKDPDTQRTVFAMEFTL